MRQPLDESDGVGDQQLAPIRQLHAAHERIERDEQCVGGDRVIAGERIEQRGLARVGVADERHRGYRSLVPTFAQLRPALADLVDLSGKDADPVADAPSIRFELRFAGTPGAAATAEPGEGGRRAYQPRHQILQLGKLDLELAFTSPGAPGENIEDQLRSVENLAIERLLEVAQLCG